MPIDVRTGGYSSKLWRLHDESNPRDHGGAPRPRCNASATIARLRQPVRKLHHGRVAGERSRESANRGGASFEALSD
jgi:hypothetical protein